MSWQFKLLRTYFWLKRQFQKDNPSIASRRQAYEKLTAKFKIDSEMRFTSTEINGVSTEWTAPTGLPLDSAILFLHGGAYCLCSINTHRSMVSHIVKAANTPALSVEYRLAPEHPFPAAVDDAVSVYQGLIDMGIPPHKIIVAGDSAGGGLALSLLLSMRDKGAPLPAAGVCISPWTDLSLSGKSMVDNAEKDVMLDFHTLEESVLLYLDGVNPGNPLASPLFADLKNLPPLLIQVGADEILFSDSQLFAEKAIAAGVDVTLDVWESMQHEWQFAADFVPEGQEAIVRIAEFIQHRISGE